MDRDRHVDSARGSTGERYLAPAGWRVLVPGLPHWFWGQRDQAFIFFGFHVVATLVGLFLWGTWLSLMMLSFAYICHAISASDAIKQAAFPKFGPWAPLLAASAGLGAICYAPVMILGSTFAWPVVHQDRPREGYWVNRWAYRGTLGPRHGETIWLRAVDRTRPRLARVLANEGQKVRWSENQLQVDDSLAHPSTSAFNWFSHDLELTVPDRHVLVGFHDDSGLDMDDHERWEIVAHDEIDGRAWAKSYPVWDRCLLR